MPLLAADRASNVEAARGKDKLGKQFVTFHSRVFFCFIRFNLRLFAAAAAAAALAAAGSFFDQQRWILILKAGATGQNQTAFELSGDLHEAYNQIIAQHTDSMLFCIIQAF